MNRFLELESYIDETLNAFVQKLGAKFADKLDDKPIFSWDAIADLTFGRPYGFLEQERDVENLMSTSTIGLYYFAIVSQIPWIGHLLDKNPIVQIGPRPLLAAIQYAARSVAEYQQKVPAAEKCCDDKHFLARYLRWKDEYSDIVDDNQVVNYLLVNVVAGEDTTAVVMRAVTYHLAKHPKAYQELVSELDSANLSLPAQWKDIRNLPYLYAVLRETIRLSSGIPMILERVVPRGGFTLPMVDSSPPEQSLASTLQSRILTTISLDPMLIRLIQIDGCGKRTKVRRHSILVEDKCLMWQTLRLGEEIVFVWDDIWHS
ncbi:hypothetical protein ACMFMF_001296 [Clarireedia jacksonii]